jgi:hypothetical protein
MADINLNGKKLNVDDNIAQQIKNLVSRDDLVKLVNEYLTDDKLGKHTDLKDDYLEILQKTLQVEPAIFKDDLLRNKIKLGTFESPISSILTNSKLSGDLKPSYLGLCLDVTTERPAIGKGEFLFAVTFANLGFSKNTGDLIDIESKKKIEVKGISAILGNAQSGKFRQMSAETMRTVFKTLEIDDVARSEYYLSEENAKKIKTAIGLDREKALRTFTYLQNLRNENEALAKSAVSLYFDKKQLIRTVTAMHLYAYMRVEKDDYLLILNDKKFMLTEAPKSLYEAYDIIDKLVVKPWHQGEYGIKVTLR